MHKLYLFVLCVLSAIASSSAHDLGRENPNPPGISTSTPDSERRLSPGQRFAKPDYNPFYRPGALVYGPPKVATFKNFTQPSPLVFNQTYRTGGGNVEERWGKHFYDVLHRNGTVQPVGFPLDIFKDLELRNGSISSEITKGHLPYGSPDNWKRDSHDSREKEKRYIIGPDGRVEILNTRVFPFNTVGLVGSSKGSCTGTYFLCERTSCEISDIIGFLGTLIGPHHVLTAGHCVHSGGSSGSWFSDIDFTLTYRPGSGDQSISTQTFAWSHLFSAQGWTEDANYDYDYALITLQDTKTAFPRMGFGWNSGINKDWIVNVNGFPEDKPRDTMWHTDDIVTNVNDNYFDANIDITPGNSGGGVYRYLPSDGSRIIYGIVSTQRMEKVPNFPDFWNTHTVLFNRATRINQASFWQICSWMNAGIC
jgi:V8-like Glu-specific endopeptidase